MPGPTQHGGRSRPCEAMPRKRWPLALSRLGVRDRSTRIVLKAFELQLVWRAGRVRAASAANSPAAIHR